MSVTSFETMGLDRSDWARTDTRIWIRRNQLHRRNLDSLTRCEIALGLEADLREKARENKRVAGENFGRGQEKLLPISAKAIAPELTLDQPPKAPPAPKAAIVRVDTRKEIAAAAGVSHDTIDKARVVLASATDAVQGRDPRRRPSHAWTPASRGFPPLFMLSGLSGSPRAGRRPMSSRMRIGFATFANRSAGFDAALFTALRSRVL